MFITSGMLHWLIKSLQYVPSHVNIVIIGAELTEEEKQWIAANSNRPFHSVDRYMDDKELWEYLFLINRSDFGWLDVDCLVINPQLFSDITGIAETTAIQGLWSYPLASITPCPPSDATLRLLRTFFLYINNTALRKITSSLTISPCAYTDIPSTIGRGSSSTYFRHRYENCILSDAHKNILSRILPRDHAGTLIYPVRNVDNQDIIFFDTLVLYQLLATEFGYTMNYVRDLETYSTADRYYSNEAIHVGEISWYRSIPIIAASAEQADNGFFGHSMERYDHILSWDYTVLSESIHLLPKMYAVMHRRMKSELAKRGCHEKDAHRKLTQFLADHGISRTTLHSLFGDGNP